MAQTNVLITSAGRRVSLVRAFQKEAMNFNSQIKIYTTDLNPKLASACQISDQSFQICKVTNDEYIKDLIKICIDNHIGLIIPTIDTELLILVKNISRLQNEGISTVISDITIIENCRDKRKIHQFFDNLGLRRATDIAQPFTQFPIFVKPYDGSRSQGIYIINNELELTSEILSNKKNLFLEYFDNKEYKEYTVDLYYNKASELISVIPRERIFVRDGEVNKGCTRKNEIVGHIKRIMPCIKGMRGCITLQVFMHTVTKEVIGIEINPRFGGGYPLSYLAGANFPKWIIEEYLYDKTLTDIFDNWEDNLLMLRYDDEVLVHNYNELR